MLSTSNNFLVRLKVALKLHNPVIHEEES
jgi:hypothetical protein